MTVATRICLAALVLASAVPGRASAEMHAVQQASPIQAPTVVFDSVTVVDVEHGTLVPGQRVVIAGHRIQTVGSVQAVALPPDAQVVDARGKYLIPGLWDMHTHLHLWCAPEAEYQLFLAHGVTGIRDMGSSYPLDTLVRWRREIGAGQRVGPRMIVAGPMLTSPLPGSPPAPEGGGPPPVADSGFCNYPRPEVSVTTPAEARRVVDSLRAAGADFIKVHDVYDPATYFAVAAETRRLKMSFGGHQTMTPLVGSDSGQRSIDHALWLPAECVGDSARIETCQPLVARFRRNGTWFVPTLAAGRSPLSYTLAALRLTPSWVVPESLYATTVAQPPGLSDRLAPVPPRLRMDVAQQAGLPILTGTDTPLYGSVPGLSLQDEIANLVWAGLTPLGALQAATLNPAQYLKATDSLGTIAPGKLADLVLLDADPLAAIDNTTRIRAVVANGRYYDRAALDRLLAQAERPTRVLRTLP